MSITEINFQYLHEDNYFPAISSLTFYNQFITKLQSVVSPLNLLFVKYQSILYLYFFITPTPLSKAETVPSISNWVLWLSTLSNHNSSSPFFDISFFTARLSNSLLQFNNLWPGCVPDSTKTTTTTAFHHFCHLK